ncbi:MAG: alpha-L-fucosidase, partial [Phycisphaerae bacterium]|nr:alpha-L-fucosidase [Phycisphaerae bacterium]
MAILMVCASLGHAAEGDARQIAQGPFQPSWESLKSQYQCPDWFRDAKFGIWAHWSAQCVPEQGDWYARHMYVQGTPQYEYHVKNYGHPSKVGFMEIDNLWKAQRWDPEKLMALYKRAGAQYFVALANHHDNFDAYNSKFHPWNSVNVGPKKDIVGTWAKVARANGLRFGVSNHSAHAWHWFQTAYGYDGEGPSAGVRYDAFTLTQADGQGKWWEGLDPQQLYTGRNIVIPDGSMDLVSPLMPRGYVDVVEASQAGWSSKLISADRNNWQPRVGVAYRPWGNNTVFRAGFGLAYNITPRGVTNTGIPFVINEPDYTNPTQNPLVWPWVFPAAGGSGPSVVSLPSALRRDLRMPRVIQYSATIEHQRWDTGFSLSYVGTGTRQGIYTYNINQPLADSRLFVEKDRRFPR